MSAYNVAFSAEDLIALMLPPRTARGGASRRPLLQLQDRQCAKAGDQPRRPVMVFAETPYADHADGVAKYRSSIGRVAVTRFDGVRYSLAQYLVGEYQNDGVAETAISASGRRIAFSRPTGRACAASSPATTIQILQQRGRRAHLRLRRARVPADDDRLPAHDPHGHRDRPAHRADALRQPVCARVDGDAPRGVHAIGAPEFQSGGRVWIYDERADGTVQLLQHRRRPRPATYGNYDPAFGQAARCSPSRTTRRTTPWFGTRAASAVRRGRRAACPPPAPPVDRDRLIYSTELQPGSYEPCQGRSRWMEKGAFDYDQGMYFRFTTASASEMLMYPFSRTVAPQLA